MTTQKETHIGVEEMSEQDIDPSMIQLIARRRAQKEGKKDVYERRKEFYQSSPFSKPEEKEEKPATSWRPFGFSKERSGDEG